ncbi:MAG TPA: molybdopterin-dependent oxidoreductase [Gemmatimonadaceae bacterium]|nr:molybdopterin-dependent oxidoreductase [Gemmatimonadaceae bacterium]
MTIERRFATCPLCEAMCGIVVETDGGTVTSVRGDEEDMFSRGHVCPKAVALKDLQEDPDRQRRPVKRVGTEWQEIGWDEAFTLVARELKACQARYGRDSVAAYLGNPTVHSLGAILFVRGFVRSLRTKNRFSATSVDQLPHHLAALWMFGHPLLIPIPDLDHADHLLIIGANPAVSNGSLMTAPDVARRLKEIRRRGGRVVLVDPRRTETAALADAHHFIRPGADAFLLLAMLHVLFEERLTRPSRTAVFTDGLARLQEIAARYPPEQVVRATSMNAETIRELARDFAAAPRAVAYGRVGVSTQEFGGLACWLITALNAVAGRLDERGGAMFTRPAVDPIRSGFYSGARFGRWKSRVRGLPEFAGELPVSALAEEMDTAGPGQVRALVTHAGNPVLSTPNGMRLERALQGLDFYAAIDFYINETTRHAHVILPPTAALERDHYDLLFHALAVRNTAKFSPAIFPKSAGAKHDWEILLELTTRMADGGLLRRLRARWTAFIARRVGLRGLLDRALKGGSSGLSLRTLEREPHGVDLGPLASRLPARLRTPDKRVRLAPEEFTRDLPRLDAALHRMSADRNGELALIGRRELRSNNSWMHNYARLVRGKRQCTALMHLSDAAGRGLVDGDRVRVSSRVGEIELELETTDDVMPGVVSIPHGWGPGRNGVRLTVANEHAGASVNDLTDDARVDVLTGNAGFSGVPVRVQRAH